MGDNTVFTIKETMEVLKISRVTVMALIKSQKIKGVRANAKWLITSDSIKSFLQGA